ncbi:MAG: UDP-N-acetylmuramoyl-tripeptide--D-alanyl-D-alanine ligase [Alloprevotella sp.]
MEISELHQLFLQCGEVTTDSRNLPKGSLFFALRGERFDGNAFAAKALEGGCAYAVVDDENLPADPRFIHVENALTTLQQLAAFHRRFLGVPILQITGTNGKTTTKELTAAVLSEKHHIIYTQGNLNNHIGVPLTLLRLAPEHDMGVIETGANHPGEIDFLSRIVDADEGIITNVGRAHLEGFGSFEGVIQTKTELYRYLQSKTGTSVFLRGDDEILSQRVGSLPTVTYGSAGHGYDVEGEVVDCAPFLRFRFRVGGGEWHEVQTQLIGAYNLPNALAAIAVGSRHGITAEQAAAAIANYVPSNRRSELVKTERNRLIVDAYNANPTSMKAALDNFALISAPRKLAILGEMRELGAVSAEEHRRVVEQAAAIPNTELWLVGENFRPFVPEGARWFADVEAVKQTLQTDCPSDALILVKGSNGTRLFQLPEFL